MSQPPTSQLHEVARLAARIIEEMSLVIEGKPQQLRTAVTVLLAEGHLLIEDVPGVGKTVLARSLGRAIDGDFRRIQFTPDLLPSDVTGVSVFNQSTREFEFKRGGVFAHIVLGDEINRASPKTQSALLEAMAESQVSVDGHSYQLARPFMVIATQNPIEQAGTYRLPEAQLDRFLLKTSLGYPDHASTVQILAGSATRDRTAGLRPRITTDAVADMADMAADVHVDDAVLDYISRLAEATRTDTRTRLGVSVRGCLALVRCAKVWAAAQGRAFVVPDDVKDLAEPVLAHRLVLDVESEFAGVTAPEIIQDVLATTAPPVERVG